MKNAPLPYVNIRFRVPSLFRCFRDCGMELVAEDLQAQTRSDLLLPKTARVPGFRLLMSETAVVTLSHE